MIETNRRSLITGLISLIAAPAIIRAGSLMPVKTILPLSEWEPIGEVFAGQIQYAPTLIDGSYGSLITWIYDGHNWIRIDDI